MGALDLDALVDAVFCAASDPGRMSATLQQVLVGVGADAARLTLTTNEGGRSWSQGARFAYDVTCEARVDTVHAVLALGHATSDPVARAAAVVLGQDLTWFFAKAFHDEITVRDLQARNCDLAVVLERVSVPLLVLDAESRIRYANATALAYLRCADGIRESAGAVLVTDSIEHRKFVEAVGRSARGDAAAPRMQLLTRSKGSPLAAILAPDAGDPPHSRVLVALHDADAIEAVDASWLQRLYGLTGTERALVEALAQGDTVQEFAAARDCSEHTARSHLKSVLAKTDAGRQPEVVRMLAAAPGRWA